MAERKQKTLAQIALKKEGEWNEDFLKAFRPWAERWNRICGDPDELLRALDVRTDEGLATIILQGIDPAKMKAQAIVLATSGAALAKGAATAVKAKTVAEIHKHATKAEKITVPANKWVWIFYGIALLLSIITFIRMLPS
jgi:hypothetical protein